MKSTLKKQYGGLDASAYLHEKAVRLRIHSVDATTAAGSGHPTSCASSAEIVSTLFFGVMRNGASNDVFVLSKGHAAPLLYGALAEAGVLEVSELNGLRTLGSDLEGHPTPRVPGVPVATGSLGQGLSAGVGAAIAARHLSPSARRVYVVLGDGECMEGSIWEAAAIAAHYRLSNLCATVDVNGLGQSEPAPLGRNMEAHKRRWESFGWNALVVDGHNPAELLKAYESARRERRRPTVVIAATHKGKGIPAVEDRDGFHGKALSAEQAMDAIDRWNQQLHAASGPRVVPAAHPHVPLAGATQPPEEPVHLSLDWKPGDKPMATRHAFGHALAALGKVNDRLVVLDGDVKNSTGTGEFAGEFPSRFFQMFIGEQNMVGVAMGLASSGFVPVAATFACFLTRAADFVRMAAISGSNVKFVGSHSGVSIGEDGPSQMGLEDLALFCAQPNVTVLYPCDAVSTWRATELALRHEGPFYLRTTRSATPILYGDSTGFALGKCHILRQSERDSVTIVTAGITVFEALKAHEALSRDGIDVTVVDAFSIQPIDTAAISSCARRTGGRVLTVEDHYYHGGLGDAVARALSPHGIPVRRMAVGTIPHSGEPEELLDRYELSAPHIDAAIRRLLAEAEQPAAPPQPDTALDPVEEAGIESFPASDPPSWTGSHVP